MNKNTHIGLLLLRISIGGLMLFHGVEKLLHGVGGITEKMGLFGYAVYIGEVLAPIAILIGFRTKIASLLVAFTCIVAAVTVHPDQIFSLTKHGGYGLELLALFFFGALASFFTGGGKYAVSTNNKWD